jgi:hypothetical protein
MKSTASKPGLTPLPSSENDVTSISQMETSANRELYLDWNDNLAAIFEANMKPN